MKVKMLLPDEVVNDNIRNPEVFDDVRSDIDLSTRPVSAVIEHHPVLRPPHVVSQADTDLLNIIHEVSK